MILLDTSALAKLLVEEAESAALEEVLTTRYRPRELTISTLAVTELRRLGIRLQLDVEHVDALLRVFTVLRLPESVLLLAGRLPYRHLVTLDAIHVATAVSVGAEAVVTYDRRMADAAAGEGLAVLNPGRD